MLNDVESEFIALTYVAILTVQEQIAWGQRPFTAMIPEEPYY